ncbi:ABC transporter substrate-binding protein [Chitinimonas viridis]|uniref:ABC transporter substrate-binding protein n=1 Tax=Chitinimonas viridis TaxID=664880 RepID=A0ABT8B2H3_9NEIS|nr:ABC transporter substrate-binding protein [Chitinimonas viridis]MDN3576229.1 ABC transporter substrate-binding protein [Chitinimonas viridis]
MFTKRTLTRGLLLSSLLLGCTAQAAERLVILTSDIAEIVVALGHAPDVVGRDRSSRQTALAHATDIGLSRGVAVESVARLKPSLVLGSPMAMPDGIWQQLSGLGIKAVKLGTREDGSDYANTIRRVGGLIGADAAASKLASDWQHAMRPAPSIGRRVLITYEGKTVAGSDTPADALIRAAGGINAAAGVSGYKPLDPEAIAKLAPELILVADHNRAVYGGLESFKRRPDIAATPAGQHGRVYEVPVQDFFVVNLSSPAAVQKLRTLL